MRLDKFTVKAQEAVVARAGARSTHATTAKSFRCTCSRPCWRERKALCCRWCKRLELYRQTFRERRHRTDGCRTRPVPKPACAVRRTCFAPSQKEADRLKDDYVSTEHLMLGCEGENGAHTLLIQTGVSHDAILTALKDVRGGQRVTDQNPEDKYQALKRYGRDLIEPPPG